MSVYSELYFDFNGWNIGSSFEAGNSTIMNALESGINTDFENILLRKFSYDGRKALSGQEVTDYKIMYLSDISKFKLIVKDQYVLFNALNVPDGLVFNSDNCKGSISVIDSTTINCVLSSPIIVSNSIYVTQFNIAIFNYDSASTAGKQSAIVDLISAIREYVPTMIDMMSYDDRQLLANKTITEIGIKHTSSEIIVNLLDSVNYTFGLLTTLEGMEQNYPTSTRTDGDYTYFSVSPYTYRFELTTLKSIDFIDETVVSVASQMPKVLSGVRTKLNDILNMNLSPADSETWDDKMIYEFFLQYSEREAKVLWSSPGPVTAVTHGGSIVGFLVDEDGNVYRANGGSIDKISPSGDLISTNNAGGSVVGFTVDQHGSIYVAVRKPSLYEYIYKLGSDGWSYTLATFYDMWTEYPYAISVDSYGNVYVTQVIHTYHILYFKFSPTGTLLYRHSSSGYNDMVTSSIIHENYIYSAYASHDGTVSDGVHKLSLDGTEITSFNGSGGIVNDMCVDKEGCLIFGSKDNSVVKIDPDGNIMWKYDGHSAGVNTVSVDDEGFIYTGSADHTSKKLSPDGVLVNSYTGATDSNLYTRVSNVGDVYCGDAKNNTIVKIEYLPKRLDVAVQPMNPGFSLLSAGHIEVNTTISGAVLSQGYNGTVGLYYAYLLNALYHYYRPQVNPNFELGYPNDKIKTFTALVDPTIKAAKTKIDDIISLVNGSKNINGIIPILTHELDGLTSGICFINLKITRRKSDNINTDIVYTIVFRDEYNNRIEKTIDVTDKDDFDTFMLTGIPQVAGDVGDVAIFESTNSIIAYGDASILETIKNIPMATSSYGSSVGRVFFNKYSGLATDSQIDLWTQVFNSVIDNLQLFIDNYEYKQKFEGKYLTAVGVSFFKDSTCEFYLKYDGDTDTILSLGVDMYDRLIGVADGLITGWTTINSDTYEHPMNRLILPVIPVNPPVIEYSTGKNYNILLDIDIPDSVTLLESKKEIIEACTSFSALETAINDEFNKYTDGVTCAYIEVYRDVNDTSTLEVNYKLTIRTDYKPEVNWTIDTTKMTDLSTKMWGELSLVNPSTVTSNNVSAKLYTGYKVYCGDSELADISPDITKGDNYGTAYFPRYDKLSTDKRRLQITKFIDEITKDVANTSLEIMTPVTYENVRGKTITTFKLSYNSTDKNLILDATDNGNSTTIVTYAVDSGFSSSYAQGDLDLTGIDSTKYPSSSGDECDLVIPGILFPGMVDSDVVLKGSSDQSVQKDPNADIEFLVKAVDAELESAVDKLAKFIADPKNYKSTLMRKGLRGEITDVIVDSDSPDIVIKAGESSVSIALHTNINKTKLVDRLKTIAPNVKNS